MTVFSHRNAKNVNSVNLGYLGFSDVKSPGIFTDKSSHMNSSQHREAIYLALMTVPAGKVITYGQLASLAGLPGAARLAGTVLCGLPEKTELPWHRVINAQGKISLPVDSASYKEQLRRLENEGVKIVNGKIKLNDYRWVF